MIWIVLFLSMIWLHIYDDYHTQGILAQFKQEKWWEENYPQDLYKNDWKIALYEHAFQWSFTVMLPLLVYSMWAWKESGLYHGLIWWTGLLAINTGIHAEIDNEKANKLEISLFTDQILHILQIGFTIIFFMTGVN